MKNKLFKNLITCISLFFIYYILTHNELINQNIIFAINLWITKIFPSLFPMFILNELLIYSGFPKIISNLFSKLSNKLFHISGNSLYVFFMSIFSGAPANAIILTEMYNNNQISSQEASLTLAFTFFSNPVFLYTMLSDIFNSSTVIKIIFTHYISNIIIIFLLRNKLRIVKNNIQSINRDTSFSKILNKAIKKSINTLLIILGTINFYILISTVITHLFDLNNNINVLIKGTLEITQGLNALKNLKITIKLKEIIAISIISFGGLSIHSQIQNVITDTKIQYKYFFLGRILQVIIGILLVIFI